MEGMADHELLELMQPFMGKQFGTTVVDVCVAVIVRVVVWGLKTVVGGNVVWDVSIEVWRGMRYER